MGALPRRAAKQDRLRRFEVSRRPPIEELLFAAGVRAELGGEGPRQTAVGRLANGSFQLLQATPDMPVLLPDDERAPR